MQVRDSFLPFALPDIGREELEELQEAILSGWITTGPKTKQFEKEFADFIGAKHAVAVNSCTAAMHLALEAVGVARDDEVITTPYTFAATAEVIRYFDAKPVFVDIDPGTLNLNPALIEGAITERTKAIIPVHISGWPADLDSIRAVAGRYRLPVIEDAAHAFPTFYKGSIIGSLSEFTCFSFYATKTLTTGEGGMICTEDDDFAARCRVMALHGISKDAWKRYTAEGSWYYEIMAPGYKYNMTDIAAAMGIAQLRKANRMWERRRKIAEIYTNAFASLPEFQTPFDGMEHSHAWHLYLLRLNLTHLKIGRAEFIDELKRYNIGTSVHFIPLHIHPYYRQTYGYQPNDYPVAFREYQRVISLPIYSKLSDEDVRDVTDAVIKIIEENRC